MTKRLEDHSYLKTLAKTNQFSRARSLRFGQVEALSCLLPPDLRAALWVLLILTCWRVRKTLSYARERSFFEQGLRVIPFVLCAVTAFSWVPIPLFSRRGTPNLKELPDPHVARKPREGGFRTGVF